MALEISGDAIRWNHQSNSFWDPMVKRIHKKLAGWKKSYISLGGRLTLIKATLSNVFVYYMSFFKVPRKIQQDLDKCQRDFLWLGAFDKKDYLVKWEDVYRLKVFGGLGIRHLNKKNIALLRKWLWRFSNGESSLWHSIIHKKYGFDPNG